MAEFPQLGRYEIRRILGQGAMGVVYESFDPTLNRRVAIKTILKSHNLDPSTAKEYSKRFEREAQAAARLNHAHIVRIHDFGEDDEVAYIVMEYIQGRELKSFFANEERFRLEEVVRIMCELLDALNFAHEANVIHRDVKPANVILDSQLRVKLADFGVARIQDAVDRSQAGTMVGTPVYMSPEQITGANIDRRTDVFSSGVILYELLTGKRPFAGAGAWTVTRQIVQEDPPPPSTLGFSISSVFDLVVNKALAKKAENRFATASDFAAALRRAQSATLESANASLSKSTRSGPQQSVRQPPPAARGEVQGAHKLEMEMELEFWRSIKDSNDTQELEMFLRKFPKSTYAELAQLKLEKLRDSTVAFANAEETRVLRETVDKSNLETANTSAPEADKTTVHEGESRKREFQQRAQKDIGAGLRRTGSEERKDPVFTGNDTILEVRRPDVVLGGSEKRKRSLVIPITIAVFAVAIGGGLWFELQDKKANPESLPSTQAEHKATATDRKELERRAREKAEAEQKEATEKIAAEQRATAEKAAQDAKLADERAARAIAEEEQKKAAENTQANKNLAEKSTRAAENEAKKRASSELAQLEKLRAEKIAVERAAAEKTAAEKTAAEHAAAEKAAAEKAAAQRAAETAKQPGGSTVVANRAEDGRLRPCTVLGGGVTWTNCIAEITLSNGDKYVGEFRDGTYSQGTMTLLSGAKYIGDFRNGTYNGKGNMTLPSGAKYVGEFRNGTYSGQGTMTLPDGTKYVGEFRSGKPHGNGTTLHPDGEKYVGEYRDGKFNGQGTYSATSGMKYVGEFRDDKRSGQGAEYRPDGSVQRQGLWANGIFVGGK